MFAPLSQMDFFGEMTGFVLAFLIGVGFGFTLERAGFGNARKLAAQFYFRDLTVFKVMFTAVVVAMIGIYYFNAFGWLDLSLIYINPTYIWPQLLGGLILGVGFVIGGYCPGTGLVACATMKIDGIMFLLGVFAGIFVFSELFFLFEPLFTGGYIGDSFTLDKLLSIRPGIIAFVVVLIALAGFYGAEKLEAKFNK